MLEAGMKAPEFALPDQNGKVHTLEEYKGKKVILYFYPRDNTPGCTKQACGFGESQNLKKYYQKDQKVIIKNAMYIPLEANEYLFPPDPRHKITKDI